MTSAPLIANTGLDKAKGMDLLRSGDADAIAYGSLYIANPDLVARFKADAPLAEPDPATFYGSGPKGYTDYSALPAKDERPSRAVPRCHASRAAARRNAKSLCCLCRSVPRLRRSRRHRSG